MTKQELIGTWKLKTFEIEDPNGKVTPWGKNQTGFLVYTVEGFMSVAINSDVEGGSEELSALFDAMLFYAGRFELRGSDTVVHHVTHASDRNRIGQEMVREVRLQGFELSVIGRGGYGVSQLIWEKVSG